MRCQQPQLESTNLHVVHFPARLLGPGGKQCLSCCSAHAITGHRFWPSLLIYAALVVQLVKLGRGRLSAPNSLPHARQPCAMC